MNVRKSFIISFLSKQFYSTSVIKPKICVIGSGPAGFYASQYLQRRLDPVQIDIYEKYPVPFGLVRYGVAPDHPNVKNCINTFTKTAECSNVNYYGNVTLGKDVTLKQLREAYHIVLLTYGASENRRLNIPGEDLEGVLSARKFVGWYNGVPDDANLSVNLKDTSEIVILGQGNVAIDVARILLTPFDALKCTDIPEYALEALSKASISSVYVVGRRGPIQAAFTTKELREMLKLQKCHTDWQKSDFHQIDTLLSNLSRPKKRLVELMLSSVKETNVKIGKCKRFKPRFYLSPSAIESSDKNRYLINFTVNKLCDSGDLLKVQAVPTEKSVKIGADLVFVSVGYKSTRADSDLPFDDDRGIVKNIQGRIDSGLYACGWLSTGPVGVLVSTMHDAFSTADSIIKHMESESLMSQQKPGFEEICKILTKRHVQVVTWKDWLKIDEFERKAGEKFGKPREKVTSIAKMLKIVS